MSAQTTSFLFSKTVGPVTVVLPHLPGLGVMAAVAAVTSLVGTGSKPNFVRESSSPVVKSIGVFCQFGLVDFGKYAALRAAELQYEKRHLVGEHACMVVACIFAGVLEPVRAALDLFVFVSQLPFQTAAAILGGAIGVFLACRTERTDPAVYTFGINDVLAYIKRLEGLKQLEDFLNRGKVASA